MPNWCSNNLTLTHDDPEMIERAVIAFGNGKFLNEFVPVPSGLNESSSPNNNNPDELRVKYGYSDWYSFCIGEWGTKWDVGSGDGYVTELDSNNVNFSFDSAWSPPIEAYKKFEELGFKLNAYYYEPGCAFVGQYTDGRDEYYEYSDMDADQVKEQIPKEIDDMFGISDSMEEWENEDNDLDYGPLGHQ